MITFHTPKEDEQVLPIWVRHELSRLRGRVTDLESALPFGGRALRLLATHTTYCNALTSDAPYCHCPEPGGASPDTAEIVCSDTGRGTHKPVIDIDMPCSLVPSATPGHFHLYIEKEVEHSAYMELLDALVHAGVVEAGYARASRDRGYSAVRHPDRLAKTRKVRGQEAVA